MSSPIHRILELARWSPSGDNTQPWEFQVIDDTHLVVHGRDTRDDCVYDLDGHPSQISLGALLETIVIAAGTQGQCVESVERRRRDDDPDDRHPTFHLYFRAHAPGDATQVDSLAEQIPKRSVQRRPMRMRPLTSAERATLEKAVAAGYSIHWIEGFGARLRTALLMFRSAHLRLTIPEAYEVHSRVIQWKASFSEDRVPDQALGIDALTTCLMRHVMKSWERVRFFNSFLAGTWAPRLQMDLLPGIACAAHFVLIAKAPPSSVDDYVEAGRQLQRFWLTATKLGLQLQPELTPLIFSRYFKSDLHFSAVPGATEEAGEVAAGLTMLVGTQVAENAVFMGGIGAGPAARSRSVRKKLDALMRPMGERIRARLNDVAHPG